HKLRMEPDDVFAAVSASVAQARRHTDDVEWSAEDATRTDHDFLCRCVEAAIEAGATTINIPDTVGYSFPQEYGALIAMLRERVPNIDKAILSTHCHNDLGLAVANSLAGVMAGARQVECAVNGLGERAGNAALEEIVMALRVRGDGMPFDTGVTSEHIARASKHVSTITGFPIQYNKAIVGKNAFAHESGIHQDGMLKNNQTYEIMTPESVGMQASSLVMGKHSGRHAFRNKLKELGYELGDNRLEDAFTRFKELADRKKHVYDEDLVALVDDEIAHGADRMKVVALKVVAGTGGPQTAELTMEIDGAEAAAVAEGNGPVDAVFNAIRKLTPHAASLTLYQVHAVTEGTDAQAQVSVRLSENDKLAQGWAADADTLVASAKAYVAALNKLDVKRGRSAPGAAPKETSAAG
ncbi:MAG: 2-isopropylmalate synthase, partial [Pseudomonadota bacterium]